MLEGIKCSYFYKEIFSYVNEKIKLKLAKYNKDFKIKQILILIIINISLENILYTKQIKKEKNIIIIMIMRINLYMQVNI